MIRCLALLAALLAGCTAAAPSPPPRSVSGTLTLTQETRVERSDTDCRGTGGYDDIAPGVPVVVRDDTARVLGTGRLVPVPLASRQTTDEQFRNRFRCSYTFEVSGLPDVPFYSVEVGNRGELTYSAAELEETDWRVDLVLGD